jgi:hypothetical protein
MLVSPKNLPSKKTSICTLNLPCQGPTLGGVSLTVLDSCCQLLCPGISDSSWSSSKCRSSNSHRTFRPLRIGPCEAGRRPPGAGGEAARNGRSPALSIQDQRRPHQQCSEHNRPAIPRLQSFIPIFGSIFGSREATRARCHGSSGSVVLGWDDHRRSKVPGRRRRRFPEHTDRRSAPKTRGYRRRPRYGHGHNIHRSAGLRLSIEEGPQHREPPIFRPSVCPRIYDDCRCFRLVASGNRCTGLGKHQAYHACATYSTTADRRLKS